MPVKSRKLPEQNYLKECFEYDFDTGKLFWKERPPKHFKTDSYCERWNSRYSGKEAMCSVHKNGYKTGCLDYKTTKAHRIIYKLVTGEDPEFIDHENGVRTDNRFSNLRSVNKVVNGKNVKKSTRNTSGYIGVSFDKRLKKWNAYITHNGRKINIGFFEKLSCAVAARKLKEKEFDYHENHGR